MRDERRDPLADKIDPALKPQLGLAGRVLLLVIGFVMLAEIAVYVPAIALFRENWLRDRLSAASTAVLLLDATAAQVPDRLIDDALAAVRARTIVLKMQDSRRLLAAGETPSRIDVRYDMRTAGFFEAVSAAFGTLTTRRNRMMAVIGPAPMGGEYIEITIPEAPLRQAMLVHSRNLLALSLIISLIVASLAAMSINGLVLRPMRRLTSSIISFGAAPEDASRIIRPSGLGHEIGRAEQALADMQRALLRELSEKKNLAALGLAVAKVSHDLRNMLASAQLLSDRFVESSDPVAKRLAPKLIATLDRAIAFCQSTLTYGRAVERAPNIRAMGLRGVIREASEVLMPEGASRVTIRNDVQKGLQVQADPEQMFRVFLNLLRNAKEALETAGPQPGRAAEIIITAVVRNGVVVVEVADTGPGVPLAAQKRLFEPFKASSRPGGTGLGLAIAADLVRAHGGTIALVPSDAGLGATFRITLPAAEAAPDADGSAISPSA
jgi:signal transduction histidine kinase